MRLANLGEFVSSTCRHLRDRPDTEHVQLLIRAGASLVLAIFLFSSDNTDRGNFVALVSLFIGAIASPIMFFHLLRDLEIHPGRRWIAVAIDSVVFPTCVVIGGLETLPFVSIVIWTSIGHGLRFGRRYLYVATGCSTLTFLSVGMLDTTWSLDPSVLIPTIVCISFIPLYFGHLMYQRDIVGSQLHNAVKRDGLTDLPGRLLLNEAIEENVAPTHSFALLIIDLDGFKSVNDGFGHAAGDALLRAAAGRMRGVADEGQQLFRLGGDEFACLFTAPAEEIEAIAARLAQRMILVIYEPFDLGTACSSVSASVGIAIGKKGQRGGSFLLDQADHALHFAKERGKARAEWFTESLRRTTERQAQVEQRLRVAVARQEIALYFQPQVDSFSGKPVAVEALARWFDGELGIVPPAEFVHVAEQSGLVQQLGRQLLGLACERAACWTGAAADLRISVNVSVAELLHPDFVQRVAEILAASGLNPSRLELEITETRAAHAGIANQLEDLRALGINLAIDDFGAGATSLAYFRTLPFDTLKLDKRFIDDLLVDQTARSVVFSVISLAKSLDKVVIAEGVEELGQAGLLRDQGCHLMQGYLFARPMAEAELMEFVESMSEGGCFSDVAGFQKVPDRRESRTRRTIECDGARCKPVLESTPLDPGVEG